jgi:hypothetical protein
LLEKKHPPPVLHNLSIFFNIPHYGYSRNRYVTKTWYHEHFCEIESNFKSVQLFIYILYGKYNKHTCREVSLGGEFGKLPATRGASNSGLTEPASMFGFYTIHIVALCDIFIDVLSTFSGPKYHWALKRQSPLKPSKIENTWQMRKNKKSSYFFQWYSNVYSETWWGLLSEILF